jgi:hypothetical protein
MEYGIDHLSEVVTTPEALSAAEVLENYKQGLANMTESLASSVQPATDLDADFFRLSAAATKAIAPSLSERQKTMLDHTTRENGRVHGLGMKRRLKSLKGMGEVMEPSVDGMIYDEARSRTEKGFRHRNVEKLIKLASPAARPVIRESAHRLREQIAAKEKAVKYLGPAAAEHSVRY